MLGVRFRFRSGGEESAYDADGILSPGGDEQRSIYSADGTLSRSSNSWRSRAKSMGMLTGEYQKALAQQVAKLPAKKEAVRSERSVQEGG